jgi:hypothetical protein
LGVFSLGIGRYAASGVHYSNFRLPNFGLSEKCEFTTDFKPIAECRNSDVPENLVWGDSYAMAIVPGLIASTSPAPNLVQATRSVCGPLLGVAFTNAANYTRGWARSCIRFNDTVLSYLKETASIQTVILASPFDQFFSGKVLVRDSRGEFGLTVFDPERAAEAFLRTLAELRQVGRKIVVIVPPPRATFDVARCLERIDEGLPVIHASPDCTIDLAEDRKNNAGVRKFFAKVMAESDATFIDLPAILCDDKKCRTRIDGIALYRDSGHLSHEGARYIFKRFPVFSPRASEQ